MLNVQTNKLSHVCLEMHITHIYCAMFTEGTFRSRRGEDIKMHVPTVCVYILVCNIVCMCVSMHVYLHGHSTAFCEEATKHSYASVMRNILKEENT